jgi:hypothetical protein
MHSLAFWYFLFKYSESIIIYNFMWEISAVPFSEKMTESDREKDFRPGKLL